MHRQADRAGTRARLQGVICLTDRLASGVYRALAERGLRISGEVSIASFDDDDLALYLNPQLTTAALPYELMGVLAVGGVLDPAPEPR